MARRLVVERDFGRYRVEDESITTWRIRDSQSGEIVRTDMEHYEAHLEAQRMNAEATSSPQPPAAA